MPRRRLEATWTLGKATFSANSAQESPTNTTFEVPVAGVAAAANSRMWPKKTKCVAISAAKTQRNMRLIKPRIRVLGGTHPITVDIKDDLQNARAALRAREPPPPLPRTIDAALSYLEEASPEALATHRVRLVALADRATAAPHPSPVASRDDEDALDEDFYFSHKIYSDAK